MSDVPCKDYIESRLSARMEEIKADLDSMSSSAGMDLGNMLAGAAEELLARPAANIASQAINMLFQGIDEYLVNNPIAEAAAQLMDIVSATEELQLLLFGRLRDSLVEYLDKRIIMTQKVKRIAQNMLIAASALPPSAEDEIIRQVQSSEANLRNAIRLLEATINQLNRTPPLYMHSFVVRAGDSVESAINVLGGTTGNEIATEFDTDKLEVGAPGIVREFGDTIRDTIVPYVENQAEQYKIAFLGIQAGFKDLAETIVFTDKEYGWFIPTIMQIPLLGARGDTIAGISPKIQFTARQLQIFPFQIVGLNYLVMAALAGITRSKEELEAIQTDMLSELDSVLNRPAGPFRAGNLYGKKLVWLTQLNLASIALGNSRVNIFNEVGSDLSNLLEDINSLYSIIDYLSQPDYIDNINNRVDQIVSLCVRMLPTAVGAFFNPTANAIFKNYLQDLNIHCNILLSQDNNLRSVLNRLDLTDNENGPAARFMEAYDNMLATMGLEDMFNIGGGGLTTLITTLAGGTLTSFINSAVDAAQSGENWRDSLANNNPFTYIMSGASASWRDMVDCMQEHKVTIGVPQGIQTAEDSPLVVVKGLEESINTDVHGLKMQIAAVTPHVSDWSAYADKKYFSDTALDEEE